jgi:hypothetical protein
MAAYKNYLKLCLLFVLVLCLLLLCNYILIYRAYENISYKEIVENQQQMHAIWGSALNPHTVSYKYELFKRKKPELIALGSSVSYEFRQEFFKAPFTNCGGVMPFLHCGTTFLEKILKIHKPRIVILILDFWCFNDRCPKSNFEISFADRGTDYLIYKLRQPFVWFWQGKLSLSDYINILVFGDNKNKVTNYNNMGIVAIKRSDGFREDGSYSYAGVITGFYKGFYDKKFKNTIEHVEDGTGQFVHGENLAEHNINELNRILKICQGQDIKLIVIMPPVAPIVYQKMQAMPGAYKFIDKLREHVLSLPIEAYDFLNSQEFSFSDSEFIDGFHPGDVVDQKMLLTIIKQNPQSVLRDYLNIDLMQKSVKENAGKAMTKYNNSMYNYNEVDFLEIGCPK